MSEDCDSRGTIAAPDEAADPEPDPDQRLSIDIVVHAGDWPELYDLETMATAVARAVADELALTGCAREVALALSSDDAVRVLNRTYRGYDRPTNVLSFPAPPTEPLSRDAGAASFIGDIVLAAETVRREASARGVPLRHHFAHLLAHGILHLFGYDHLDDVPALEMETLETKVLHRLGIPDPYSTDQQAEETLGSAG
jgi:probable rRNA maturation factor